MGYRAKTPKLMSLAALAIVAAMMAKPSQSWLIQQSSRPVLVSTLMSVQQRRHSLPTKYHQKQPQYLVFGPSLLPGINSRLCSSTSPDSSADALPVAISTSLGTDEAAWKREGERIIMKAATEAGASPEMMNIQWKSGLLVVTVDGSAYIAAEDDTALELEEEEEEMDFADEFLDDEDFVNDEDFVDDDDSLDFDMEDDFDPLENGFVEESSVEETPSGGVDVVAIAKAVNRAFDEAGEGTIGYNIAVHHSIEVTTPGATDELSGIMFESYKGFGIILEFRDAKTGKTKKIEGKLIERNDEYTQINERGRMRKFKNDLVVRVTLPKAKTEKGVNANKKTKNKPKTKAKKKKRK